MTDTSPTPPERQNPQLDPADDADEPAFDWMKPASAGKRAEGESPVTEDPTSEGPAPETASTENSAENSTEISTEVSSLRGQPGSRADRKAAEAAVGQSGTGNRAVFNEPLQTSALQIRPPQEEVERRNAEREHAANAKPIAPRVMQVLLAVFYPVILLVLAVRAVTSPLFLWVEYNRPGFPGDGYGFNTDDRLTYGSYAVDYLSNWSGPRYLGELVSRSGDRLFKEGEVSHMADVKLVILSAFGAGALLALLSLIAVIYLRRRSTGGVRRGLFAGSIVTLVIVSGLGVLAALGWEQFFTEFHSIFFANGTWTFSLQDTLIRLFPGQFWVDAGIVIGALVLLTALVTVILTWPTRRRRGLTKEGTVKEVSVKGAVKKGAVKKGALKGTVKDADVEDGTADQEPAVPARDAGNATDPEQEASAADGRPARGHTSAV
ncbi:TIGR01906 family membrane protein [Pseudarthrobacter sp. S9]|uniref:TIGR01906 family membrane protein n=1 Tax=Pseudarthrobacter sp. S9 TaxID=3418421 RepID=UPI003D062CAE